jgi:hypothetical protein
MRPTSLKEVEGIMKDLAFGKSHSLDAFTIYFFQVG